MMKRLLAFVLVACTPTLAFAGGNEFPGNGTEAIGRGAAFTAKASDGTALDYNIAGLATQRGTNMLLDANIVFNTYDFTRSGMDPNNGNKPYSKVSNSGGPFFAPFFGLSTDFNKFDRWTFAIGIFGPSSVGNRTFPSMIGSIPSPNRYDITKVNLLLFFPTLAASVRVTHWMDIGFALELTYGTFDLANVANVPLSPTLCKGDQYGPCDTTTDLKMTGFTATAALGLMFHVGKVLDIGVNVRGPVDMKASGMVYATTAPNAPGPLNMTIQPSTATFETFLPWVVRLGIRHPFVSRRDGFEHGDIELDGDYEAWHQAEGDGDKIHIDNLSLFMNLNPVVTHHYQDTFSVRLGGAWNVRLPVGVFTIRAGTYYESAATKDADTRLDFDTMEKVAGTGGLGYRVRGIAINVGYAYIWEPDRVVTNGDIHALNGIDGSQVEPNGQPTPVINNGSYHANNQILSLGLTVSWEELVRGKKRRIYWE